MDLVCEQFLTMVWVFVKLDNQINFFFWNKYKWKRNEFILMKSFFLFRSYNHKFGVCVCPCVFDWCNIDTFWKWCEHIVWWWEMKIENEWIKLYRSKENMDYRNFFFFPKNYDIDDHHSDDDGIILVCFL